MIELLAWLPCASVWFIALSAKVSHAVRTHRAGGDESSCHVRRRSLIRNGARVVASKTTGCRGFCRMNHRAWISSPRSCESNRPECREVL
jgi:hypothetical protein